MDMDYAHYMLTEGRKGKDKPAVWSSPSSEPYQKLLADTFNITSGRRILAFKNKAPAFVNPIPQELLSSVRQPKIVKAWRHIPQVSSYSTSSIEISTD